MLKNIYLIEEKNYTVQELDLLFPGQAIVAVDFAVSGIERSFIKNGLHTVGLVSNCDHHIPVSQFEKVVSSTNLAICYVNQYGKLPEKTVVVINHVDCDSVLASLILKGFLPTDDKFGNAAIAADHTGEENDIADLLNSLQKFKSLNYSVNNLMLFLGEDQIPKKVLDLIEIRRDDRKRAWELVENAGLEFLDGVYYGTLNRKIDGAFLPALLPDAKIILIFTPLNGDASRLEVKVRLGFNAPEGKHLNNIGIKEFDPAYGGRWNAGSNKRGGGTSLKPLDYVKEILKRI